MPRRTKEDGSGTVRFVQSIDDSSGWPAPLTWLIVNDPNEAPATIVFPLSGPATTFDVVARAMLTVDAWAGKLHRSATATVATAANFIFMVIKSLHFESLVKQPGYFRYATHAQSEYRRRRPPRFRTSDLLTEKRFRVVSRSSECLNANQRRTQLQSQK